MTSRMTSRPAHPPPPLVDDERLEPLSRAELARYHRNAIGLLISC